MRQRDWFQTYFWLLKALYEVKPIGLQLTFNIFRCPSISHTIKKLHKTLGWYRYVQIRHFGKGSGNGYSTAFCVWFFIKIFLMLTDKTSVSDAFTSWDIEQYVYCNSLLTRLWRHKFWNWPYISNQVVFLYD